MLSTSAVLAGLRLTAIWRESRHKSPWALRRQGPRGAIQGGIGTESNPLKEILRGCRQMAVDRHRRSAITPFLFRWPAFDGPGTPIAEVGTV